MYVSNWHQAGKSTNGRWEGKWVEERHWYGVCSVTTGLLLRKVSVMSTMGCELETVSLHGDA